MSTENLGNLIKRADLLFDSTDRSDPTTQSNLNGIIYQSYLFTGQSLDKRYKKLPLQSSRCGKAHEHLLAAIQMHKPIFVLLDDLRLHQKKMEPKGLQQTIATPALGPSFF